MLVSSKQKRVTELWATSKEEDSYDIHAYSFCEMSLQTL